MDDHDPCRVIGSCILWVNIFYLRINFTFVLRRDYGGEPVVVMVVLVCETKRGKYVKG